jgi:hypothetical protein
MSTGRTTLAEDERHFCVIVYTNVFVVYVEKSYHIEQLRVQDHLLRHILVQAFRAHHIVKF